jgi:hypothetical protein
MLAQGKNFIKQATEIWIEPKDASNNTIWRIMVEDYTFMGNYHSEERAKQVIQDIYLTLKAGNNCYEMPEK